MSVPREKSGWSLRTQWQSARERVSWIIDALRGIWHSWSLSRQFLTCASLVLIPAMWVIGIWVADRIEESATTRAGSSAALYMENFIEPLVQDLATGPQLPDEGRDRIGRLLQDSTIGQRVHTLKIWGKGAIVIASNRPELVGRHFPPSASLRRAWSGLVTASFDNLREPENQTERAYGMPLLEVYVPIRSRGSDRVLCVAEFYENADDLKIELQRARWLSWLVVSAVTLSMLSALLVIVRRGSQTIEAQQASLEQQVAELTNLLAENRHLRARAHRASARSSESNEVQLRRLGTELHDGPAQLISVALLRLKEPVLAADLAPVSVDHEADPNRSSVRAVLTDALRDIRNIAAGLAVPEIDGLSLTASLQDAVERHRRLTGTAVDLRCNTLPDPVPHAVKLCAFRFVQECLSNAFRHASGVGQTVVAETEGADLLLRVSDDGGKRVRPLPVAGPLSGLGLKGLRDRIESLGGSLDIEQRSDQGWQVTARIPTAPGTA